MFSPIVRFLLLLFTFACGVHAGPPPNIVFIISDDQAWGDYGFMGHAQVRTPHLDRLAAQSLVFPRGYVPSSLCCPSLASIITGRFPHDHGITSNDPVVPAGLKSAAKMQHPQFVAGRGEMARLMARAAPLPQVLAGKGYLSFQTGKWWQGHFSTGGFTHGMSLGEAAPGGGRHGDAGLKIGRETMQPIFDFIATARVEKKPFLVWYAPMLPHDPHNAPERIFQKYKATAPSESVARYWANIERFDETCGQLLGHLDEHGLAENTVVVFVADNGWIQNPDNPRFAPKSKQSPYDGGLRTPILLRWPGSIAPHRSDALATSLDLYPTLLRAAGVEVPANLPGLDLRDATALGARRQIFGECFTHDAQNLADPAASLRWRWMIDGHAKVIAPAEQNQPGQKPELYDLAADPFEDNNLALLQPKRVSEMLRRLDDWWPGKVPSSPGPH